MLPEGTHTMECHEITNLFPEMSDKEFQELYSDINRRGLIDPIVTHEGQIVDGRHRYRVCLLLGKAPVFREWGGEGGSLTGFVISKNLRRRHLTASQRSTLGVKAKSLLEEEIRVELSKKAREAGRKGGRGRRKVPSAGGPAETAGAAGDKPDAPRSRGDRAEAEGLPVAADASGRVTTAGGSIEKGVTKDGKTLSSRRRCAQTEAAAVVGVSKGYIAAAEKVRDNDPALFARLEAGEVTLSQAVKAMVDATPESTGAAGPRTEDPPSRPGDGGGPDDGPAAGPDEFSLTLSRDPEVAAAELAQHFRGEELAELVRQLAKLAGLRVAADPAALPPGRARS